MATKHGLHRSREYGIWRGMRERCGNPRRPEYPNYGGRGIRVCDRWQEFAAFYEDMGPCPPGYSIDRIDNDGNYEPGNCRWASRVEQQRNRSDNALLTIDGVTATLAEWSERSGLRHATLDARLRRGWDPALAISRRPARGQRVAGAPCKLSNEQVASLRDLYATGTYTAAALGEMFGVSKSFAHAVATRRFYTRVA